MTTPQNPNDPNNLSLNPTGTADNSKKADFSNVQSGSASTEAKSDRPDFSNVESGSASTEEAIGVTSYTVQKGDTLSAIAKEVYGKASAWKQIFEANRDQLDNPDLIKPGQVLKIPRAD